jgi:hypothetical protein
MIKNRDMAPLFITSAFLPRPRISGGCCLITRNKTDYIINILAIMTPPNISPQSKPNLDSSRVAEAATARRRAEKMHFPTGVATHAPFPLLAPSRTVRLSF